MTATRIDPLAAYPAAIREAFLARAPEIAAQWLSMAHWRIKNLRDSNGGTTVPARGLNCWHPVEREARALRECLVLNTSYEVSPNLEANAERFGRDAATAWLHKTFQKLGDLQDAEVSGHGSSLTVTGKVNGRRVTLEQQVIVKNSPIDSALVHLNLSAPPPTRIHASN